MIKTKVIPIGKKVLVKPKEVTRLVPGTNIIIPDSAIQKEYKAYVIGVGTEVTEISKGDLIQYAEYCVPTEMEHEGVMHLLINVGDIHAIIQEVE